MFLFLLLQRDYLIHVADAFVAIINVVADIAILMFSLLSYVVFIPFALS